MQQHRIITLLQQKVSGRISSAEWAELSASLDEEQLANWEGILLADMLSTQPDTHLDTTRWEAVLTKVIAVDKSPTADFKSAVGDFPESPNIQHVHFLRTTWFRYAAAVILIFCSGIYLWLHDTPSPANLAAVPVAFPDIAPGKAGAILTLDDGSRVILDSLGNGRVATEKGTTVTVRNGQVIYDITSETDKEMAYNIMTTPHGRKAHVVLSDGSQVWLNAGSSMRYAVAFKGERRLVELLGEAYFEIAKNESLPFIVKARDGAQVEVLGTRFNINSYENEPAINTTLLEGSIKVQKDNRPVILKPGQQAQINTTITVQEDADTEKAIAWKNGLFNFEDASLEEVMRQLVRWYDIEVVYKSGVPDIHFVGKMSMNLNLSGLIRALEASKVHVKREGERRLVIYP